MIVTSTFVRGPTSNGITLTMQVIISALPLLVRAVYRSCSFDFAGSVFWWVSRKYMGRCRKVWIILMKVWNVVLCTESDIDIQACQSTHPSCSHIVRPLHFYLKSTCFSRCWHGYFLWISCNSCHIYMYLNYVECGVWRMWVSYVGSQ